MNNLALSIGLPFAELRFSKFERERIAKLDKDPGKALEATASRDRLLTRFEGVLQNAYFMATIARGHTPEERRIALETRRRTDLKDQISR
jgi:hypothetical protein